MAKKIDIEGIKITDVKSHGISVSGSTDFRLRNAEITGASGSGLYFGDEPHPQSLTQLLGIPADTDPKLIVELLRALHGKPPEQVEETVKNSTLGKKLMAGGVNIVGLVANIVTAAPMVCKLLGVPNPLG
jgi:hypothetical protein